MYRRMYIARDPYSSDFHHLIRENYHQVFFNKEILGTHLPFHLEREFKKYLICGNLAFGMARFHCSLCQKDKLVAFSCTGRRMSDTAKHLIEELIPTVPTRQWVLSMPNAYRYFTGQNPQSQKSKSWSNYSRSAFWWSTQSNRASLEVSYKSSGIILPNNIKQKPASTSSLFRIGTIEVRPGLLS
jgi:hypothetical protein